MKVQWAVKGLSLDDDEAARVILRSRVGLMSNWGRARGGIPASEIHDKLTPQSIDMHVNHFNDTDPVTKKPYSMESPYISLSCGAIERSAAARTNFIHRARRTALYFGTRYGEKDDAYLFHCWVVVAPRAAVELQGVAEEIRDLTAYRRYSAFHDQGEVAAKLLVPANQIRNCEKWVWDRPARIFRRTENWFNDDFIAPERLTNVMELL